MKPNKISYNTIKQNTRLTDFNALKDTVIEHHRHLKMDKKQILKIRGNTKNG